MNSLIEFDRKLIKETKMFLVGTDEAGRGPGAGDVYAAAVCFLDYTFDFIKELNDSKQLKEKDREKFYELIKKNSIYAIETSTVAEIEKNNILNASLNAMNKAVLKVQKQLSKKSFVIVDGNKLIKNPDLKQKFIIKGDAKSASIAAASILAKVERDKYMKDLAKRFPQYDWENNKGYLTVKHLEAIDKFGITEYHRKKFLEKHFETSKQLQLL